MWATIIKEPINYEEAGPYGNGLMSSSDWIKLDGIAAGASATLSGLTDTSISSPSNGQILGYNSTSGKWENNTALEVDASGNVTAGGNITDGQGNVLAEVSALEVTQSGNPIIVNAQGIDAKELSVALEPIQDLHGYDKPWSGGAGKNKLPITLARLKTLNNSGGTWSDNVFTVNNATITVNTDDGGNLVSIVVNGTPNANITFQVANPTEFNAIGSGTFTMNGCPSGGATDGSTYFLGFYKPGASANDFGSGVSITLSGSETSSNMYIRVASGYQANNLTYRPMLRTSGDANYAPYSNVSPISGRTETSVTTRNEDNTDSNTATVTLGQTVYGGIVDFNSGKVDDKFNIIDMGSMTWIYNSSTGAMDSSISDIKRPASDNEAVNAVCSVAKIIPASERGSSTSMDFYAFSNSNTVCVRRSGYTDATAFKTAMTGQKICYEKATPTEITVLPQALYMLSGYNYITADGNMEITLIPESILDEAKAYTDSALADKTDTSVVGPVESGSTASKAYAVGEHFIRNDKFCTAIAAIASGATLTLNTNYVEGTIAEALKRTETYSTSEVEVGTWNGARLYRKMIPISALPNNASVAYPTGLTNVSYVKVEGSFYNANTGSTFGPIISSPTGQQYNMNTFFNNNNVVIETGMDRSGYSGYVVIYYTKNS